LAEVNRTLADSDAPSTGVIRLSEWANEHGGTLGRHYLNELDLHFARQRGADEARPSRPRYKIVSISAGLVGKCPVVSGPG
jgi:hypothetical protein